MDLASLFNPQAQASVSDGQPATSQDGWDAFLSNPATRAALLSFGLNTLAGGWGSPMQNLAQAAGAGLETGGAVGANEEAQAQKDAAIARQQQRFSQEDALKREEMANRTDIARIAADTRVATANIRANQPRTNAELAAFNRTLNSTAAGLRLQPSYLSGAMTEEDVQRISQEAAFRGLDAARSAGASGGTGANPPAPGSSENLAAPGGVPGAAGTVGQENSPGVAPSQNNGPVGTSSPPEGAQIYTNKKTGQRIWWDGKQWQTVR